MILRAFRDAALLNSVHLNYRQKSDGILQSNAGTTTAVMAAKGRNRATGRWRHFQFKRRRSQTMPIFSAHNNGLLRQMAIL